MEMRVDYTIVLSQKSEILHPTKLVPLEPPLRVIFCQLKWVWEDLEVTAALKCADINTKPLETWKKQGNMTPSKEHK